jgi:AbiV family abortive infection protein
VELNAVEIINIQIKELENCANLSLENAEQYIKDAELLIENSSFGHAYAFAILAYEELGRTVICIFGILGCWFTDKDMITPNVKGWNKTFKNHVTKQIIMKVIDELYGAIYQLFYQRYGVKESEMKGLEVKDVKELIKKFVQSPDNAIKLTESIFSSKEKFEKDLEDLLKERGVDRVIKEIPSKRSLEKEKWRGLYVD